MSRRTHRLKHGEITCFAIRGADDSPTLPLVNLLLPPDGDEAKRPAWEKTAVVLGAHSCLLLEMAERHILIDGGFDPEVVRTGLREAGVGEIDVDLVLITHGDTDHIAGLVDAEHRLIYPNAEFVLHRELWEAWISDGKRGDPNPFYEERQRVIAQALTEQIPDRVALLDGDREVAAGIRAIASPGHRPSHMAYELAVGDACLLNVGDAMIAPVLVEQPTRGNAFDADPELGVRSRLALLERAAQPRTLTYVPHFPWPGFIRVIKEGERYTWTPSAT